MAKRESELRSERIPFGVARQKLTTKGIEDSDQFVYRWINDSGNRINDAIKGGYVFVHDDNILVGDDLNGNQDIASRVSKVVGKTEDGKPLNCYLMKIKREWYEEDQKAKMRQIDMVDTTIKNGKYQLGSDPDSTYIPEDGIKIRR